MDSDHDAERRAFLKTITAAAAATLGTGGCGGASPYSSAPGSGTNFAPVWLTVPAITFKQGVASSISIAGYVSDPNGDALTIAKNATPLPAGVTYDAAGQRFVYDGIGALASTSGHILTASDGKP